jgi:hypothetical protein
MKTCPHCSKPLAKARSSQDHRRFFGVINAAYSQWPEGNDFQPDSAEHLRAWLLCKAGYRETVFIPVEGDDPRVAKLAALAAEGAIKAAKGHSFIVVMPHGLGVVSPKSISWDKLDQRAFGPVREAVEGIIEREIGVPAGQLLTEEERAA